MEKQNDRKYRHRELPDEFWEALLQVRNYLFQDPAFQCFVCSHSYHRQPLASAFWVVDSWLDVMMTEDEIP
ncbi:MAG: hypothetical protein HY290_04295 [Planctomycetia bacterium]|nr:hypothetical protein [Planctomycetia bacterium]